MRPNTHFILSLALALSTVGRMNAEEAHSGIVALGEMNCTACHEPSDTQKAWITSKGQIFVGGSKRGWPVRGLAEHSLQRLDWTGKIPFEIKSQCGWIERPPCHQSPRVRSRSRTPSS